MQLWPRAIAAGLRITELPVARSTTTPTANSAAVSTTRAIRLTHYLEVLNDGECPRTAPESGGRQCGNPGFRHAGRHPADRVKGARQKELSKMFIHVVFFWCKQGTSDSVKEAMMRDRR